MAKTQKGKKIQKSKGIKYLFNYSFAISKVQKKVRQLSKVAQNKNRQKLLHKASNLQR